jgi:hypothetical protein
VKRKLPLPKNEDKIKAKSALALKNTTSSEVVETRLRVLSGDQLDKSFRSMGIEYNYTLPDVIVEERKKMKIIDTQKILKEIRDDMDKHLS